MKRGAGGKLKIAWGTAASHEMVVGDRGFERRGLGSVVIGDFLEDFFGDLWWLLVETDL